MDATRDRALALATIGHSWQHWFNGKDFTVDWVTGRIPIWAQAIGQARDRYRDVLEVGSLEGRSAIFWLEFLPLSVVTCIDTFTGTASHHDGIERRFDRNLASYSNRVRKIKSASALGLAQLAGEGRGFDLCYIDGSHRRDDVMVDCLLSWPMLRSGGLLILDDYGLQEADCPRDALDTFLRWHSDDLHILHRGFQVVARRR